MNPDRIRLALAVAKLDAARADALADDGAIGRYCALKDLVVEMAMALPHAADAAPLGEGEGISAPQVI